MSDSVSSLFDRYVLAPKERPTSEIKYHYDTAPGARFVLVNQDRLPESDLYVIERRVDATVTPEQEAYVDLHCHNCTSFYIFRGAEATPDSLQVEVQLGDEVRVVQSPCQVYIPAGMPHTLRIVRGPGSFIHVVLRGDFDSSLV